MITVATRNEIEACLKQFQGGTIGFVPTMGALHQGHLSLLGKAIAENQVSVVSIFINPTQFNDVNDFTKYPKDFQKDADLLMQAGCDVLFLPEYKEIYPKKVIQWTNVDLGTIEQVMEGKYRPGHFRGVKTVVYKLLDIIKPGRAYFGKKDYQQLMIIKKMVEKMKIPVQIVACDTEREEDGVAMSSRNKNLGEKERKEAGKIPLILKEAMVLLKSNAPDKVKEWVVNQFEQDTVLSLQYFEIADTETLVPVKTAEPRKARLFIAAYAGKIRLIDNMLYKG